jgi:23S rRNA pseudouridine2605 synthase
MPVRLQKFLADAGIASRRASEQIILAGRVSVNGTEVRQLGTKVQPGHDKVTVDGRPVKASRRRIYIAINKPKGFICTRHDPLKRRSIGDLLPKEWTSVYSVGRLDRDSEGLIFLTNDGDFALRLTHPRYGVRKTYRVEVEGRVEPAVLQRFVNGIVDAGDQLKAESAKLVSANNTRSVVELVLTEGKNREVRRLFASVGLNVSRLQRMRIGPIKLGELPVGKWRTLTETEINSLLSQI